MQKLARELTSKVMVGGIPMGGGSPVVVQSMLNCPSDDARANLAQIERLADVGCEIVRMAIPDRQSLRTFEEVCSKSPLPVVADVHFDPFIAIEAAWKGAAKLRINPGNIGGLEAADSVIDAAKGAGIAIRIGVNAGSLDKELKERNDLGLAEKLAMSAIGYVEHFKEAKGFCDVVVSAKAHDVLTTVSAYEIISKHLPDVPLHIGITEAGPAMQGLIKSSAGLGILLNEGIGDTLRISLTDDPVKEVQAAYQLLSALDVRKRTPEIISCPTCGRCKVNLIDLAKRVESALENVDKPIKVAVMGCIVNGPGEASDADVGVACGMESGAIFSNGRIIEKVPEDKIVSALLDLVEQYQPSSPSA